MSVSAQPLASNSAFSHEVRIKDEDFTSTGNTQTFTVSVPAGTVVQEVSHVLVEDFDSSDATLTSLAYTVGDGGDADRFLTSTEVCVDGTEVDYKSTGGAFTSAYTYTADDTIDFAFTGTSAKDLSTLNQGELVVLLKLVNTNSFK